MGKLCLNKQYSNKYVDDILVQPPLKTIKMKELLSAMNALGFIVETINGSHYKFNFPQCTEVKIPIIPRPHGGKNEVNRIYIRKIQNAIIEINERKKNIL
jgi:predicted RNA binding protein YcfA (HicA-like mRNA interferase family)